MTETEQLEEIKKWWNKHQNWILGILSILLISVAGVRYWNWHIEKTLQQASSTYDNMIVAVSKNDDKSTQSYANQLVNEYSKTVYASAAHLTLAKVFVKNKEYEKASNELNQVAHHSKNEALRQQATLRFARLLIVQKSYDKALAELATLKSSPYTALIDELKGDVFVATGKYPEADTAYHDAISLLKVEGVGNQYLQMKSNAVIALLPKK